MQLAFLTGDRLRRPEKLALIAFATMPMRRLMIIGVRRQSVVRRLVVFFVVRMGVARAGVGNWPRRVAAILETLVRMVETTPHAEVQQQQKCRDMWNGELHVRLQPGQP